MSKPIIKIVDASTGQETEREMTDAEFAQYNADLAEFEAKQNAIAEAETQKTALLTKLGITADEAKLLLS